MQSEKNIQAAMLARDQRARELEDNERNNRRKILSAISKYNLELVRRFSVMKLKIGNSS